MLGGLVLANKDARPVLTVWIQRTRKKLRCASEAVDRRRRFKPRREAASVRMSSQESSAWKTVPNSVNDCSSDACTCTTAGEAITPAAIRAEPKACGNSGLMADSELSRSASRRPSIWRFEPACRSGSETNTPMWQRHVGAVVREG